MLDVKNVIFEGLAYTLMGIVTVFAMLLIIMYVIKAMQLFSKTKEKPVVKTEPKSVEIQQAPETTQQDSTELIAVITAAIAAAMGKSSSDFVVRSFKKLSGDEWGKTGRREILENRF